MLIAIESGLPVIFLAECFTDNDFKNFLSSITQEYVLFIDEFEKIYDHEDQQKLLSIFDGMLSNKKMIILTSNEDRINQFFNNRLKRIRYRKTYNNLSNEVVREVIEDLLKNKEETENLLSVISEIGIVTMDILISIIEEMNIHNYTAKEAIVNFNIVTEKCEFRMSRVLPDGSLEYMETFETSAGIDSINLHRYFTPHINESKIGKPFSEDVSASLSFNTRVNKPVKLAFGKYEITCNANMPEHILKGDKDYNEDDKEENYRFSARKIKIILEKDYIFQSY